MDSFSSDLTEALAEIFDNILEFEEKLLKQSTNVDLSINEMHLVEHVGKSDNARKTISILAQGLNITLPSVTIAINKLVKKGYVKKERSHLDKREVYVSLTEKGLRINKIHRYFHIKMAKSVFSDMTAEEKVVVIHAMEKINSFFKRKKSRLAVENKTIKP